MTARTRGPGLFEPALPLGVDKPPAVFDEFAPSVSLGERDGELGLKLVVNRLVVPDNGVDVLFGLRVALAREWTEAGIRLVTTRLLGRVSLVGWRSGALGWSPSGRQRWQRMVDEPLTDWTRRCRPGRLYRRPVQP